LWCVYAYAGPLFLHPSFSNIALNFANLFCIVTVSLGSRYTQLTVPVNTQGNQVCHLEMAATFTEPDLPKLPPALYADPTNKVPMTTDLV
jgi:hypothetical protein